MEGMASTLLSGETYLLIPILLLIPLLFLIFKHIRKLFPSRFPPLPPGPYPWPIIGNLLYMGKKPHVALAQLAQAHGPLISLRLGTQLLIVGSSPAAATEILKTNDRLLCGRHVPHASHAKSLDHNHLSLVWAFECTEQWKFLRTLCRTELFAPKIIDAQTTPREKKVKEMVGFLCSKEGEVVRVREVVFATMFNFLGNIFVSKDFIAFDGGEKDGSLSGLIRRIVELWTAPNISDLYPIVGGFDLQGINKKGMECVRRICAVWEIIITERRENKGGGVSRQGDFLDVLCVNGFNNDQINYLLLELFGAGSDTSTSTIEWAMTELIRNDFAMKKIREELAREITTGIVKESHLPYLSYLQACVKETLRLHPPAPLLLPRRANQTCQVMNYTIPKESQVIVNVWAIGRDPAIWEDPLTFKPERFLNSDLDFKGNDFEFIPFGGGRRICPGLPMAVRQIHLTLASLIHNFEWSLPHNMQPNQLDMNEKFGMTLQKEHPLLLIPKLRL